MGLRAEVRLIHFLAPCRTLLLLHLTSKQGWPHADRWASKREVTTVVLM